MSNYTEIWMEAQEELKQLTRLDRSIMERETVVKPVDILDTVLELYLRYRKIVNRLMTCYNGMVQPQVRIYLKKVLEYSTVRMLEYRREVFDLIGYTYFCLHETLLKLKLTPEDVDLVAAGICQLERRNKIVDELITEAIGPNRLETVSLTSVQKAESLRYAVTLIQRNERTRAAKILVTNKIRVKRAQEKRRSTAPEDRNVSQAKLAERQADMTRAATVMQRHWRGICGRRKARIRRERLDEILGMTMPVWKSEKAVRQCRRDDVDLAMMQAAAEAKLEKTIDGERESIWKIRGPAMQESIQDEIRVWFNYWFEAFGFFDYIPTIEEGGSLLIATEQTRTFDEYLKSLEPPEPENEEDDYEDDPVMPSQEEEPWKLRESKALYPLLKIDEEFMGTWHFKTGDVSNPKCGLVMDFIDERLYHELQLKMREYADDIMRAELIKLNEALLQDHALDVVESFEEPFRLPEKESYPPYNVDSNIDDLRNVDETKKKKPKRKSVVLNFEDEEKEMLSRLMQWQVVTRFNSVDYELSKWPGVDSCSACGVRNALGDLVKQQVVDYCLMPMTSKLVHGSVQPLVRSVCLCGLPDTGQTFLARAICAELKAVVLDLSPHRHERRFHTRKSLQQLKEAVVKIAKIAAPTVILVEACDEVYLTKGVPAKRFAPILKKIAKSIRPGNQVLFLSTSSTAAKAKRTLVKLHDKFIVTHFCDYGTRYLAMKKQLMRQRGVDRHLDVSSVARLANWLAVQRLEPAINDCWNYERRRREPRTPLHPAEILERLFLEQHPPEDVAGFDKFLEKLRK